MASKTLQEKVEREASRRYKSLSAKNAFAEGARYALHMQYPKNVIKDCAVSLLAHNPVLIDGVWTCCECDKIFESKDEAACHEAIKMLAVIKKEASTSSR